MNSHSITSQPVSPIPPDDLRRSLTLARPNEDQSLPHIGIVGDTYTILLSGDDTDGRFCLIDMHIPPGGGPGRHRHDFEESFMLLEGEIEATFRGEKMTVRAGDTLNILSPTLPCRRCGCCAYVRLRDRKSSSSKSVCLSRLARQPRPSSMRPAKRPSRKNPRRSALNTGQNCCRLREREPTREENEMKLDGKIAVITGASQGIGKTIAVRLAEDGATVGVNYREDAAPADALVAELTGRGLKAQAFRADVSKPAECRTLMEAVGAAFGRVDILVSNAGVESFGKLEEITEQEYERVFSVNVAGQLFVTQAAAPLMSPGGRIVLTSSVSAKSSIFYHTLYAASKAAVSAMVLNLAPELGERGITINAVAPGGTETHMAKENGAQYMPPALRDLPPETLLKLIKSKTALQRQAQPEEIAAAVAFLVSSDASYITGSTLKVDGGKI